MMNVLPSTRSAVPAAFWNKPLTVDPVPVLSTMRNTSCPPSAGVKLLMNCRSSRAPLSETVRLSPITISWSYCVPAAVPPISAAKLLPAENVTLPSTVKTPGD